MPVVDSTAVEGVQSGSTEFSTTTIGDEPSPHNPHDGLVKRIFTKPEAAAIELQHALGPALAAMLDWSSLRVEPGSFVDPSLAARQSDVLYSVPWRGSEERLLVYVLLEHQSTVDRLMALRFLIYITRIWERLLAECSEPVRSIPMIVPVLLFQGRTGWTAPRRLSELMAIPPDRSPLPAPVELEFIIETLRESLVLDGRLRDEAKLRAHALVEAARTLLWLAVHPEEVHSERAQKLGALLDIVRERWNLDELRALFTYVISAFESETPLQAILLRSASRETRQMFTSIRDHWIAEGQAEGQARGMARMLEHLLDRRGLEVTSEQRDRITACDDPDQLQRWFDRALAAATTDEIFD